MRDDILEFRLWNLVVGLVVALLGVGLLALSYQMPEAGFSRYLSQQLSAVLMIAGLWAVAYDYFVRRSFLATVRATEDRILHRLACTDGEVELGLAGVWPHQSDYSYERLLSGQGRVDILLNDGRTWVSTHNELLERRLKSGLETRFFLLHPGSAMLPVLARKVGAPTEALVAKIQETVSMIQQVSPPNSRVEVWGHHLWNPHALFAGDRFAALTPYYVSRGRRSVPLYEYEDRGENCYFRTLREDLEALTLDADLLWSSEPTQ